MKSKSILFVNRWVGYNQGGNESHIKDLIVWMKKRGHKTYVITTKGEALKPIEKYIDKVEYIKGSTGYYSYSLLSFFDVFIFFIRTTIAFIKIASTKRIDVMSIHFSLEGMWWRFVRIFVDIPQVFVFAGDTSLEIIEGSFADKGVHISKFMAQRSTQFGYNTSIIPKGIDTAKFCPNGKKYKSKFINKSSRVILTVCRLDPRKNLATLVKSARILTKEDNRYRFLIVGEGIERKSLEKLIRTYKLQKYIKLLGVIPQSSQLLPDLYRRADVFALPTLYEGFGWVFLEAMACKLPIVSTLAGSNPEVLKNRGYLVPVKSPLLFAKAIQNSFTKRRTTKKYVSNGYKFAKKLSWKIVSKKYSKVYLRSSSNRKSFFTRLHDFMYGNFLQFKNLFFNSANIITKKDVWKPDITQN